MPKRREKFFVPEDLTGLPDSNSEINSRALAFLKSKGHNVTDVWYVYSAGNRHSPGYEVILYSSYRRKRTAWVWRENGVQKIDTKNGWFEMAGPPPQKKS